MLTVEATHRDHAIIEQVIADLKDSALAHLPSGVFTATAARLVRAAIAHNLTRAAGALAKLVPCPSPPPGHDREPTAEQPGGPAGQPCPEACTPPEEPTTATSQVLRWIQAEWRLRRPVHRRRAVGPHRR